MWSNLLRTVTNLLYLVPFWVWRYRRKHPEATVHAAGACKAREFEDETDVRREAGWVTARRGVLMLTDEGFSIGDWNIPLESVETAELEKLQTLLSEAFVLKVTTTTGRHYQFGLQKDPDWERQSALAIDVSEGDLLWSTFSVVFRVALAAAVLFWAWYAY